MHAFGFEQPRDSWSKGNYPDVYARDGHACRYCGSTSWLSIDHVIPRAQGGSDEADNLVVCCRSCNSRKGGRTPSQAGMVLREVER
jgi:5-methylcytosine-specific restriction endonuclease McrA